MLKNSCNKSRGVTRGEKERNSSGAELLLGRRMTAGDAEKSKQYHKHFLQYSKFASG